MKFLCKVIVYATLACVAKASEPTTCEEACPSNPACGCASTVSRIPTAQTPQFVTITFDDAVTPSLETYITDIFTNRFNPDGNPCTGTIYVPHPYTDYEVVNRICNKGHEIGLNSVSKNGVDYWRNINSNQTNLEFSDGRTILATFANVPFTKVNGARIPNLEVAGDATFAGYSQAGVDHDSSCAVSGSMKLFPFNLNYPTNVKCFTGSLPTQSYPGIWVLPIVALTRKDGFPCATLAGCDTIGRDFEVAEWLQEQFRAFYYGNRAPMTFLVNTVWFQTGNGLRGLKLFLDYLKELTDVYVVSHQEVLRWAANPTPVPYNTTVDINACGTCNNPRTCTYYTENNENREMRICGGCPIVYPEQGNPTGTTPLIGFSFNNS